MWLFDSMGPFLGYAWALILERTNVGRLGSAVIYSAVGIRGDSTVYSFQRTGFARQGSFLYYHHRTTSFWQFLKPLHEKLSRRTIERLSGTGLLHLGTAGGRSR